MPAVTLFRALRYDAARVRMDRVVCPPYDVISAEEALRFRSDPLNAIWIDMPGGEPDGYAFAADRLRRWRKEGVLAREERPSLYVLEQRFEGPDGVARTRRGVIARLRLDDRMDESVKPHELTNPSPRRDRMALLRATNTHLSPVFLLSDVREKRVWRALSNAVEAAPPVTVRDADGAEHTLRTVAGAGAEQAVSLLSDRGLVIADGHHRFETALAYRDERRAAGDRSAEWLMAYFCAMDDPGLAIFPAHRLVRLQETLSAEEVRTRLDGTFAVVGSWSDDLSDPAMLLRRLRELAPDPAFAIVLPAERLTLIVELRDRGPLRRLVAAGMDATVAGLGVTVLHQVLLPQIAGVRPGTSEGVIDYESRPAEAFARLRGGGYGLGAFLNPPTLADVVKVTAAGETMPHKATYFYPKLPTGLVFDPLEESV
jgi:uncharacterized protein (DUF1015 family)